MFAGFFHNPEKKLPQTVSPPNSLHCRNYMQTSTLHVMQKRVGVHKTKLQSGTLQVFSC